MKSELGRDYSGEQFSNGLCLRNFRQALGLTQMQLVEATERKVSQSHVTRLECGNTPFTEPAKTRIWDALFKKEAEQSKKLETMLADVRTKAREWFKEHPNEEFPGTPESKKFLAQRDNSGMWPWESVQLSYDDPLNPSEKLSPMEYWRRELWLMEHDRNLKEDQLTAVKSKLDTANDTIAMLVNLLNIETKNLLGAEEAAALRGKVTQRVQTEHPDVCADVERKREGDK